MHELVSIQRLLCHTAQFNGDVDGRRMNACFLTIIFIYLTNCFAFSSLLPVAAIYSCREEAFVSPHRGLHHQPFFIKLLIPNYCKGSLLSQLMFTKQGTTEPLM